MPKKRCLWVPQGDDLYAEYHDDEWGVPVHDDRLLFEMLTLEGAQAGLSWRIVLSKRGGYREAFANFDPQKVARFTEKKIEKLLANPGIVRNKLKVNSTIGNAKALLKVQKEFGSFDNYIWSFVDHKPVVNKFKELKDFPAKTELSDKISKELKKRGFRFVGSTIIYAFMQAVGMVNDHTVDCFRHKEVMKQY